MSSTRDPSTILLFDVDGTLTASRQRISLDMESFMANLKKMYYVGLVGGSDAEKIAEQMGGPLTVLKNYDYVFSENGLVAYKEGELFSQQSILGHLGEEKLQTFINFALRYLSELKLPAKRGNFVEFRSGMINVSPVGRSCSLAERLHFVEYDNEHKIREKFIQKLEEQFSDLGLQFSIGGQISIDCFPHGWDKTYCLQHLQKDGFKTIHFFGDKIMKGGNDHEIYEDPRTIGHSVTSPEDTKNQLKKLLNI